MADAEPLAGECVHDRPVAGAVVGQHTLDPDAPAAEVADGAAEETGSGRALLVGEHFDIGKPGRVVDRDVDELPADPTAARPAVAVGSVAGPADLAELLDVDMDEFARPRPLVAVCRLLRRDPRELPEPVPDKDGADGRQRHPERFRDLRAGKAQLAQRDDQLFAIGRRPRRHRHRRRGPILKPRLALASEPINPLPRRPLADTGGLGRRRQRPPLDQHPIHEQPPRARARPGVAMQCHRPTSLESLMASATTSLQGRSDEQRSWDLHLDRGRVRARRVASAPSRDPPRADAAGAFRLPEKGSAQRSGVAVGPTQPRVTRLDRFLKRRAAWSPR